MRPEPITYRGIIYRWRRVTYGVYTMDGAVVDLFDAQESVQTWLMAELDARKADYKVAVEDMVKRHRYGYRQVPTMVAVRFAKRLRGIRWYRSPFRLVVRYPDPSVRFTGRFVVDVQDVDLVAAGARAWADLLARIETRPETAS